MHHRFIITAFVFSSVFLTACKHQEPTPLPQGPQTLTGTLVPAELSAVRRGTHVLRRKGVDVSLAESKTLNLREYEQKEVAITGVYEKNVRKSDPPVLVVTEIVSFAVEAAQWPISSFRLTVSAPAVWKGVVDANGAKFTLDGVSVLTIERRSLDGVSFDDMRDGALGAVPALIGKRQAFRLLDEVSGAQTVYIEDGDGVIVFLFQPDAGGDIDQQRASFLSLLSSVTFSKSASTTTHTGTGASAKQPCGGSAGILCPAGYYCNITDLELNIGVCTR